MDALLELLLPWVTKTVLPWLVNVIASYPGYAAALLVLFVVGQVMALAGRKRYPDVATRPEFWVWFLIVADILSWSPSTILKYFRKPDPNPPLVTPVKGNG